MVGGKEGGLKMAFDIETLGIGTGGGLIGAILGVLGINRRVNKIEKEKQDKTLCEVIHKGIDDKFDILIKGQDRIFERIDTISDRLRGVK